MKIGSFLFIVMIIAFSCHDTGPVPEDNHIIWNYDSLLGRYEGISIWHGAEYKDFYQVIHHYDTNMVYLNVLSVIEKSDGDFFVNTDGVYPAGFDVSRSEVIKDTMKMIEHRVVIPFLARLTYFKKEEEINTYFYTYGGHSGYSEFQCFLKKK